MNDTRVKVYETGVLNKKYDGVIGEIVDINKEGLIVKTKDSSIIIKEIKLEGKKRTKVKDYLNGVKDKNNLIGIILK